MNELLKEGFERNILFCPSNIKQNDDYYWNFPQTYGGAFKVLGYVFAVEHAPRLLDEYGQTRLSVAKPVPLGGRSSGTRRVAVNDATLVTDATLSIGANKVHPERNQWTGIQGANASLLHDTAHMEKKIPAGGNQAFLDGHAEWVRFQDFDVRTSGSPAFWF